MISVLDKATWYVTDCTYKKCAEDHALLSVTLDTDGDVFINDNEAQIFLTSDEIPALARILEQIVQANG